MIRRICLALAMASLCVTAWAKPPVLPMPLAADLPVEVVMSQHELAVDVPNTAGAVGGQFGLLGMLIASGIQNVQVKNAEERVVPLRNLLLDYHFNERVEAALRAKLASEGVSPAPAIKVLSTPWDAADAQADKQAMPLHALVLLPRYAIDAGFNTMTVSLTAQLVDRTVKANGKVKTKYDFVRTYGFHFPLTGPAPAGQENPQRWIGLGAARLAALLDQGVAQSTDMLVYDLSAEGRAQWEQKYKHQSAMVAGVNYPGFAVRQGEGWAWLRNSFGFGGAAQTFEGYQPVTDAAPVTAVAATSQPAADVPAAVATPATAATPAAAAPAQAPAAAMPASAANAPAAPATNGAQ